MAKVPAFWRVPAGEWLLLAEAVVFLLIAKCIITFVPFDKGRRFYPNPSNPDPNPHPTRLKKIRRAVRRANRLAWWQNVCIVQSIAARMMLSRRNIHSDLSLGVQYDGQQDLSAHAWLKAGPIFITPRGKQSFREIHTM
jgi:hypothetical protein